jgi:hypothetical protein
MKKKFFSILFALVLSLGLAIAVSVAANSVPSSTMIFEGQLAENGDGTYSGVIPMVNEAVGPIGDGEPGYDVYAEDGALAWFGNDPGSGPVWTSYEIFDHDAWPDWDPDTPDWYQYSLNLYVDGDLQKWAVRNHPGATAAHPWYDTAHWGGEGKPPMGVPMSGAMDWTGMYAAETDVGAYLPSTGTPEIPDGAANYGGGPMSWDMDWSWGSEVVPLQYPGFSVEVIPLEDSGYRVILTHTFPSYGFVTGGGWINSPPHAYMPGPNGPDPVGTIVVTPSNVGVDWFTNDTRFDGYAEFVDGPGIPPLGSGSLEMGTTAGQDKAQLFNYDHMGTLLDNIDSITYATYRDSSSTNSLVQYPAINIEVDYAGDGSSYTTSTPTTTWQWIRGKSGIPWPPHKRAF